MYFVVAVQCLFLVFLTVFLFNHADPKGDGMEMVGVGGAFMLFFLPFSLPAFILAKEGRLVWGRPSGRYCGFSVFRLLVPDSR